MRTTIELITYGKPNLNELPKREQQVFFETLLKHIQELHKKDKE
jgi:3-dehydroquinate dehydratase